MLRLHLARDAGSRDALIADRALLAPPAPRKNARSEPPIPGVLFPLPAGHDGTVSMAAAAQPLDVLFFDRKGELHHVQVAVGPDYPDPVFSESETFASDLVLDLPAGVALERGLLPGEASLALGEPVACD